MEMTSIYLNMFKYALVRLQWLAERYYHQPPTDGAGRKVLHIGRYDDFFVDALDRVATEHLSGEWAISRLKTAEDSRLLAGSPYDWPEYGDGSFDLILSTHALEHMPFPWLALGEAERTLKYGGLLVLLEPGPSQRLKDADIQFASFNLHQGLPDYYRFSALALASLAEKTGLKVRHASLNMAPPALLNSPESDLSRVWAHGGGAWLVAEKTSPGLKPEEPEAGEIKPLPQTGFGYCRPARYAVPRFVLPRPERKARKILITGSSCYAYSLGGCLEQMIPGQDVHFLVWDVIDKAIRAQYNRKTVVKLPLSLASAPALSIIPGLEEIYRQYELLIVNTLPLLSRLRALPRKSGRLTIELPMIDFQGFTPDLTHSFPYPPEYRGPSVSFAISKIVLESYFRGYSQSQAASFFSHETFSRLGYYAAWDQEVQKLSKSFLAAGLRLDYFLPEWCRRDPVFMYDGIHPKGFVWQALLADQLRKNGFEIQPGDFVPFYHARCEGVTPIYPEIASHLNIPERGSYYFKLHDESLWPGSPYPKDTYVDLERFIHHSYEMYDHYGLKRDQTASSLQLPHL